MNAVAQDAAPTAPAKAKTEYETVVMSDGRKVDFAGLTSQDRHRRLLKDVVLGDHPGIRFDFRNGETRFFSLDNVSDVKLPDGTPLVLQLALHGASQKIGDETASEKDVDDMVLAVDNIIDRLAKGEWTVAREGGGFAGTSVLLRALVELSGKSVEEVKARLSTMSQAEKLAVRNSPKVKPVVERLEAEKTAKAAKVDTDALLAGLV